MEPVLQIKIINLRKFADAEMRKTDNVENVRGYFYFSVAMLFSVNAGFKKSNICYVAPRNVMH